jgi:hypothetical protein
MRRSLIAVLIATGCAGSADSYVSRSWDVCLWRDEPSAAGPVCGTLTADALAGDSGRWSGQIRYSVPIHRLWEQVPAAPPPAEGAAEWDGHELGLRMGVKQSARRDERVFTHDDGSVVATLTGGDGALVGRWERTCLGGCTEKGRIEMRSTSAAGSGPE